MRLYVEGRLKTTQAADGDLKNALARLKDGTVRDVELLDGERRLSLRRQDGALFLDVIDGLRVRYGLLIDAPRARQALSTFLKGGLPMPAPVIPMTGPEVRSFVVGDAAHPDCPLCQMLGLDL